MTPPAVHAAAALAVSFGLSLVFWAAFDVFAAGPFVVVSTSAAALGGLVGWFAGRRLLVTIAATAALRIAAFVAATWGG